MRVPRTAQDPRASPTGDPKLDALRVRGMNKPANVRHSVVVREVEKRMKKRKKGPLPTPGEGNVLPTVAVLPTGGPANGPPPQMSGSGY